MSYILISIQKNFLQTQFKEPTSTGEIDFPSSFFILLPNT